MHEYNTAKSIIIAGVAHVFPGARRPSKPKAEQIETGPRGTVLTPSGLPLYI